MGAAWGSTFFMIKDVLTRVGVADLLAVRFSLAAVVVVIIGFRQLRMSRGTLLRGIALGALYGIAQLLQTAGLAMTDASTSGFVTGLYVVITPLLGALVLRDRTSRWTWLAVGLATVGLGVLSLNGLSIGGGELLTLASAAIYACHILALSRWSRPETAVGLTIVQMIVIALLCLLAALPGGIQLPPEPGDWARVAYLALIAGAAAVFLQTWAQSIVEPTRAAVIMSSEPVWAAVFAVAFGGESITWRMVLGGASIVAAMYLVEMAPRLGRRRRLAAARGDPV